MSNSKGIEQNNEYGITSYDPSQFAISNGILTKYLGHNSIVEVPNIVEQISSSAVSYTHLDVYKRQSHSC